MNPNYSFVADRAAHRCEYCHAPELVFNFPFEVEHIIPLCREGLDTESNLALACRSCNLRKGSRINALDPESGVEVGFFSPRQDRWDEHFRADAESGAIIGLTPSGRVTVACLEMNSPAQLTARRLWIRLSLFP
jgi:HNH endonuclease